MGTNDTEIDAIDPRNLRLAHPARTDGHSRSYFVAGGVWVLLWLQDITELVASPGDFELHTMMKEEEPNNG